MRGFRRSRISYVTTGVHQIRIQSGFFQTLHLGSRRIVRVVFLIHLFNPLLLCKTFFTSEFTFSLKCFSRLLTITYISEEATYSGYGGTTDAANYCT